MEYFRLEEVATFVNGHAFSREKYKDRGIPIIRISDIDEEIKLGNCICYPEKSLEKLKEYKFTTPRFENMAESKVLNIESGIHIADSQNSKDNDRDVPKTSENSSINNSSNNNGRPSIQDQFNRLKSIIEADFKGTLAVNYSSWHRQGESSLRIELNKGNNTYYGEFSYSANGEWIYVEFSDLSGKNYNSYKA